MIPSKGTLTFWNIARPLRASIRETSCGVVTITAPEDGSSGERQLRRPPVPGGRSITRKSSFPHATSCRNCSTAWATIGPRQMTGWLTSIRAERHH